LPKKKNVAINNSVTTVKKNKKTGLKPSEYAQKNRVSPGNIRQAKSIETSHSNQMEDPSIFGSYESNGGNTENDIINTIV
jgi:hypothetical protein